MAKEQKQAPPVAAPPAPPAESPVVDVPADVAVRGSNDPGVLPPSQRK